MKTVPTQATCSQCNRRVLCVETKDFGWICLHCSEAKSRGSAYQAGHYYRTRCSGVAFLASVGPDGKLHGSIPGVYANTWWKPNGDHNTFPSDDLMEEVTVHASR